MTDDHASARGPEAPEWIRKYLKSGDLSFESFMRLALYVRDFGYYATRRNPVGPEGDFITSPKLSPVFSFAIGRLAAEFLSRAADGVCSVVDIGCGDGTVIESIAEAVAPDYPDARFFGVDQSLGRIARRTSLVSYVTSFREVPGDVPALVFSNELFDALPFGRLVQRGRGLNELCVSLVDGERLEWSERPAPPAYVDYVRARGVELEEGQFADVSLEWETLYAAITAHFRNALFVTFDYGHEEKALFRGRARRYGTAVAYARHGATRDLLANAGEQDLTAHVNFTDLIRAGEREGSRTLLFDRQGLFLMKVGAAEHPLLRPIEDEVEGSLRDAIHVMAERQSAMRLILPEGPGADIRVLVQARTVSESDWSFQRVPQ